MEGCRKIPEVPTPETATQFVLELDLENLTDDEINYLHKLRTMAQRQMTERYIKRINDTLQSRGERIGVKVGLTSGATPNRTSTHNNEKNG